MKLIFDLPRLAQPVMVLLIILGLSSGAWGKVYLDIDAPAFQQLAIAVPDFQPAAGSSQAPGNWPAALSDDLANLLKMTGFFNVINKNAYLEDPKPLPGGGREMIHFADWLVIGTEYLLKGSFQLQGQDLILNCRLYDVVKAEVLMDKKYTGKNADLRQLTRKCASDIVLTLTGEGGIFSTRIAFVLKKGDKADLMSMNFDGTDLKKERESKSILMSPRWSPDGRHLSFTSFEEGNPDFYVKDMVTATTARISSFKGINLSGGWSPDSKKVLLTLSKDGNEEIYVMDFRNKLMQRLTTDFAIDVSPAWSPDGSRIAFVSNRGGSPQIYLMDADGNNVKRLTFEGNYNTSPAWSPKGDRLVFESLRAGKYQIVTIGADGNNAKQLTFDSGECRSPSWSPEGRYISFSKHSGGRKKIHVMNAIGANIRVLFEGSGDAVLPAWSPRLKPD